MGCVDLVVPIGPDQQEVPDIGLGQQFLKQVERCRVQPLKVIEEQRERMLVPREDAEEAPERQLESTLRLLGRKLGNRRLLSNDEFQLGDKIDHQAPVRPQRLAQGVAPMAQLRVALDE